MLFNRLAAMRITCLLGRHWPIAALSACRPGPQQSHCADCGVAMAKTHAKDWTVSDGAPITARIASLLTSLTALRPATRPRPAPNPRDPSRA